MKGSGRGRGGPLGGMRNLKEKFNRWAVGYRGEGREKFAKGELLLLYLSSSCQEQVPSLTGCIVPGGENLREIQLAPAKY